MSETIRNICNSRNIKLGSYKKNKKTIEAFGLQDYVKQTSGLCFKQNGSKDSRIILFKDELSKESKDAVVAHELGHVLLGHLSTDTLNNSKIGDCTYSELMADIFSTVLIAMVALKDADTNNI